MSDRTPAGVDPSTYLAERGFEVVTAFHPDGLGADIATADWEAITAREEKLWADEYRLTHEEFVAKYGPYEKDSMVIAVKEADANDNEAIGVLRLGFPDPDAKTFDDSGLLTVHAALHGTPGWGKLDISRETLDDLSRRYDAGTTVDVQTNVVAPDKRGQKNGGAVFPLQSVLADVADSVHGVRHDSGDTEPHAIILTAFVKKYLIGMRYWYNTADQKGLIAIGDATAYGAGPGEDWCTPAILDVTTSRGVDQVKQCPPNLVKGMLQIACPGFSESALLEQFRRTNDVS